MTPGDAMTADDLLRHFPTFPSVGKGPVQLTRVLAGMGELGLSVEALARTVMTTLQLDPALRELVILRTAWKLRNRYIWGGHRIIATDVELDLDAQRTDRPAGWPSVVRAVDELLGTARIRPVTMTALRPTLTEGEVLELVTVVGTYRLLAMVITAAGLVAEPETPELPTTWPGPVPE
jgi:alkylhydroperoxidase family enzyme